MELLSPGEKLRSIRKQLKIKQSDITGGEITRELISIIENDKCRITYQVANIISSNINKICREKNIDFTIEPSYLMEDIKVQALKIADKYIEFLYNCNEVTAEFEKALSEIEEFLMKYDVDDKALVICEKIADIYKNGHEYNESYKYYIKALENHRGFFSEKDLFRLFHKLGSICILLARYKEALEFNNSALIYKNDISNESRYKTHFNKALCYFYMKEYEVVLDEIKFMEINFKDILTQSFFKLDCFKLNSIKASCLTYLKLYIEALNIDKELLKFLDKEDTENRLMVLGNILDIYVILKDIDNVKLYIDMMIQELNILREKPQFLSNSYHLLGCAVELVGDYVLAKKYFDISIKLYRESKNMYELEGCLKDYITLLIKEDNKKEINLLKDKILEFISLGLLPKNNEINLHLISYYSSKNDMESIQSLLNSLLN